MNKTLMFALSLFITNPGLANEILFPTNKMIVSGKQAIEGVFCTHVDVFVDDEKLFSTNQVIHIVNDDTCNTNYIMVLNEPFDFSSLILGEHILRIAPTFDVNAFEPIEIVFETVADDVFVAEPRVRMINDFPYVGSKTALLWNNYRQNFMITDVQGDLVLLDVPKIGTFDNLYGYTNALPTKYKVACFTKTDAWYTKPWYNMPYTAIASDGTFEVDITTGWGSPELATEIACFVIPRTLPNIVARGTKKIPQKIVDTALYSVYNTRILSEISKVSDSNEILRTIGE